MSVTINGSTGVTTPGVVSDSYTGPISVSSSAPDNSVVVDSSGNVGIGRSSPLYKVDLTTGSLGTTSGNQQYLYRGTTYTGNNDAYEVLYDRTSSASGWTNADLVIRRNVDSTGGQSQIRFGSGSWTSFWTNSAERMRIDSSGNLLVGTTSQVGFNGGAGANINASGQIRQGFSGSADSMAQQRNTAGFYNVFFYGALNTNPSQVGGIYTGGTTTSYNTTSDYRLKHDIAPMTGALAKVSELKPVTYKWNSDGSDGEGFIAHELAEVCPQCVTGEKDAVDAEGKPVYQGIDTSFLVATLTAAIQELKAQVDAQAVEIAALKGQP